MHLTSILNNATRSLSAGKLLRRAAVAAFTFVCVAAVPAWSQIISNGTYILTNRASGLVLDDYNNSTTAGTNIDQWGNNGGNNQKWQLTNLGNNYVELVNVTSGFALDVSGQSTSQGAAIDQWPWSNTNNQKWQVVSRGGGYYELIAENSGMALEDPGSNTAQGTYMDQWGVNGGNNQLWSFTSTSGGGGGGGGANTCSGGRFLPVMGTCGYIKGANLAWLDGAYSTYLGVDPHHVDYGVSYNSSSMGAHLADMHNMGITVVRLWLFQDDQGCYLDGSGNVTGVTSQFWSNLDDTVRLAGNSHIALYMTLNNGRADFQQNSTRLNAFINNALKPLISRYKGNSAVWAIDGMNEIDGTVAGNTGNYTNSGSTWSQAQAYMRAISSAVHSVDPNRLVTVSSGWHSWTNLNEFRGQGLDFYDFHQYADNGYVPTVASLGMDKPIYVGESGQGTNTWSDSLQNTAENNFLYNTDNGLYAGLGIWDYQYPAANDVHQMLETNGSWRPVDYTIQSFRP